MVASPDPVLRGALSGKDQAEALALVHLDRDQLVFLELASASDERLRPAFESLLLRAATDAEALEALPDEHDVRYFDDEGRQIVLLAFRGKRGRYLLGAVISPRKAYKQVLKRLVKRLKTALSGTETKPAL